MTLRNQIRSKCQRSSRAPDAWERSWQKHWSKVGLPGYELPVGGPGGLGTLDELFEAATLIQCHKIAPFPLILMGSQFWRKLRRWGQFMIQQGVFAQDEIGFGRVTDSPQEAVDLIIRSLPLAVKECPKPTAI